MKVSVITLHSVLNYGSVLQTYATQQIFEKLGCIVEIVDYRRKSPLGKTVIQILKDNEYNPLLKIKLILIMPSSNRALRIFQTFLKRKVNLTETVYTCEKDFEAHPIEADVYCTGSDQVWNTGWHKEIPGPFFLNYVPEGKKKIAFSASFGKEQLEDWEKPGILAYLQKYSAISVREKSAVDIILSLDKNLKAQHVLDPTLAVEPHLWLDLAVPERVVKGKYILVYSLNHNKQFDQYTRELAKKKHMKLIRLCTRYDQIRVSEHGIVLPEVEKLLALFRDAEYVVANSFHGTAFCLVFHKQFLACYPTLYSTRVESILSLTHLQERRLKDYNDFRSIDKPIDYDTVDALLENARMKTMSFLKKAING